MEEAELESELAELLMAVAEPPSDVASAARFVWSD